MRMIIRIANWFSRGERRSSKLERSLRSDRSLLANGRCLSPKPPGGPFESTTLVTCDSALLRAFSGEFRTLPRPKFSQLRFRPKVERHCFRNKSESYRGMTRDPPTYPVNLGYPLSSIADYTTRSKFSKSRLALMYAPCIWHIPQILIFNLHRLLTFIPVKHWNMYLHSHALT